MGKIDGIVVANSAIINSAYEILFCLYFLVSIKPTQPLYHLSEWLIMVNPGNEHTDSLIDDLNFSDLEDAPGENLLVLETPLDNQSQESSLYPFLTTEVSVMYIFI